ncbi:MAG: phosphatidate cytidylyltransferase [Betaproteobacteria bacterium]|nr:phosphatidate cytidylyltransferase [Betaproteobacteria bacterium]
MLRLRVVTALGLVLSFLAALFFLPALYWSLVLLAGFGLGAYEWARLARFGRLSRGLYVGATILAGLVLLWAGCGESERASAWLPETLFALSAAFWVCIAPLWLLRRWAPHEGWALGLVGWILLLPTWAALSGLRAQGAVSLLALLMIIWIADTAAYFAGRGFGRHKLAPRISPGKTWEGVAGAFGAVGLYAVACKLAGFRGLQGLGDGVGSVLLSILVFWGLTYFGILGDLFESWMKRQAGLKDSGRILPGHGGLLDRIDALTSSMPLAALGWLWLNPQALHR